MSDKKYTAMDIANYIIWYANQKDGVDLSPIKLQKILYYVYATYLEKSNEGIEALFDEKVEKWQYGPVVRDVYFEFKTHGIEHIQCPHSILAMTENEKGIPTFEFIEFDKDKVASNPSLTELIHSVVDKLINISPFDLVEKTHQEPMWVNDKVKILAGERGLVYDDFEIKEYFKKHPVI